MFAQLGMAATLLVASTNDNLTDPKTIGFLGLVLFLHNSFQTLQDVSTDAMAMDLLPPHERGRMNGFMWASKLVATSLGGIVLATVLVRWGLPLGVRIQAGLVLADHAVPALRARARGREALSMEPGQAHGARRRLGARRGRDGRLARARWPDRFAWPASCFRALSLRTTAVAPGGRLRMIVCEGFHDALTPAVFTQALGWSAEQYSRLQGGWGLLGRILGAIGGGYVCDRLGRRLTLGVAAGTSTARLRASSA